MIVLGRALLSGPSVNITSNGGVVFSTTRSALQNAFNDRGFHGGRFLGAVSIPRFQPPVLRSGRPMSVIPTILSMSDPSPSWSTGPLKEIILWLRAL